MTGCVSMVANNSSNAIPTEVLWSKIWSHDRRNVLFRNIEATTLRDKGDCLLLFRYSILLQFPLPRPGSWILLSLVIIEYLVYLFWRSRLSLEVKTGRIQVRIHLFWVIEGSQDSISWILFLSVYSTVLKFFEILLLIIVCVCAVGINIWFISGSASLWGYLCKGVLNILTLRLLIWF